MDDLLAMQFVAKTTQFLSFLDDYDELHRRHEREAGRALMRAANVACGQVRNAMFISALIEDADQQSQRIQEAGNEYYPLFQPTGFDYFLKSERRLLEAAGAGPELIDRLILDCEDARALATDVVFNGATLQRALGAVEQTVCSAWNILKQDVDRNRNRGRWRRRMTSVGNVLGGLTIAAVNATSLVATLGLSSPVAAVSMTLGGAVAAVGTTGLIGSDQ